MDESEQWLTPAQVRDYLGLAKSKQVSEARKRGRFTCKWSDEIRGYVYLKASVDAYLLSRGQRRENAVVSAPVPPSVCPRFNRKDTGRIIYVVEALGIGMFKVGSTVHLQDRVKSLAVSCPVPLFLVHWEQGMRGDESEAHAALNASWSHGEWFKTDRASAVAAVAAACARVPRKTDTPTP